ncbi:Lethal(2) giant larvae sro7, partial [Exophiala xenobiotica]
MTAHEDSSLVFWDPRDGRAVHARTIHETDVNLPGRGSSRSGPGAVSVKEPYFNISWCSKENADETGILVAGGSPTTDPAHGLTFIDLGITPNYQTSSWDYLAGYFRNPKRTHVLPAPPNAQVTTFLTIPRLSPHFAGAHDPIAVLAALSS